MSANTDLGLKLHVSLAAFCPAVPWAFNLIWDSWTEKLLCPLPDSPLPLLFYYCSPQHRSQNLYIQSDHPRTLLFLFDIWGSVKSHKYCMIIRKDSSFSTVQQFSPASHGNVEAQPAPVVCFFSRQVCHAESRWCVSHRHSSRCGGLQEATCLPKGNWNYKGSSEFLRHMGKSSIFKCLLFYSFQKGDVVECQIEQLGSIINKVV